MKSRTFYVYVLEDPRDGAIFYVGKGTGFRMHQHVPEALKRREAGGNRRKIERILQILDAGLEVVARKVAEYEDEELAFDHEADLIAATAGLTNILARGGGWAITQEEYERRQKEREARWLAREKEKLRPRLAMWDEWERRGYTVTFPGLKDGDELAKEVVEYVREFLAA